MKVLDDGVVLLGYMACMRGAGWALGVGGLELKSWAMGLGVGRWARGGWGSDAEAEVIL